MPNLDMVYRLMATDAGAAAAFTGLSEKARVAATATQDLSAAQVRAADAMKLSADAAVRASDLRLRASAAMVEAQRLETDGDRASAVAAREAADALKAQATAAGVTSRELNASAIAAGRQAEAIRVSRDASGSSATSVRGLLGEVSGLSGALEKVPTPAAIVAGALGKIALGGAAAAAGIAAVSIHAAAKFQSATNVYVTAAGETQRGLAVVRTGIEHIAEQTGTSIDQLTSGMYTLEKAGDRGASGLRVLRAAAEGAREENADLGDVTNALTSVMASYHIDTSKSVQVMNALKTGAGEAKVTMEQFAGSLSNVIPIASANKVSIGEVLGALATLTQHGTSADRATDELGATIRALAAPNAVATNQMQQLGLSVNDVTKNIGARGLTGTIDLLVGAITQHMGPAGLVIQNAFNQSKSAAADAKIVMDQLPPSVEKLARSYADGKVSLYDWRQAVKALPADQANLAQQFAVIENKAEGFNSLLRSGNPAAQTFTAALRKMAGGAIGLNTILQLSGGNLAGFRSRADAVTKSLGDGRSSVEGWASTQRLFSVESARASQSLKVMEIELGDKLLPIATKVMNWIATDGVADLDRFGAWFDRNEGTISSFAAAAITDFRLTGDAVLDLAKLAVDAFDDMIDAVPHFLDHLVPGLGAARKDLDATRQTVDGFTNSFNSNLSNLANDVYAQGHKVGANLVGGVATGISQRRAGVLVATHQLTSQAVSEANRGLTGGEQAGAHFVEGVALGISRHTDQVLVATGKMSAAAVSEMNRGLGNASPSKKGAKAGRDLLAGVVVGVDRKKAEVFKQMHDVGKFLAEGFSSGWRGEAARLKDALSTSIQDAISSFTAAQTAELSKAQQTFKAETSKLNGLVKSARETIKQAKAERASDIASLAGSISSGSGLSNMGALSNMGTGNIGVFLGDQAAAIKRFAGDLKKAKKMGLSNELLSQIASDGPVQGDAQLQQILSGFDNIADLNRDQRTIDKYSKSAAKMIIDPQFTKQLDKDYRREQLAEDKAETTRRLMLFEIRQMRHSIERREREAAHDLARGLKVEINSSGRLKITDEDARTIVAAINKLAKHTGVRVT